MNGHKNIRRQITEDGIQKLTLSKAEGAENRNLSAVLCSLPSVLCALILAGCAQQQAQTLKQICLEDTDSLQAMRAAEKVLIEMHFTIEKADFDSGIIRTKPLPGAQFFEFWRSDNAGASSAAEANLQSIQRTVQITIIQQAKKWCVGCNVEVQRLSLPERQAGSTARAYQMFSKSSATLQKLRLNPEQEKEADWVNLGQDTELAAEILKRISMMLDYRSGIARNRESSIKYRVTKL